MCSQDTIVVESVSKRKNQSSITNEVFLDVQLRELSGKWKIKNEKK
jgi:hypothetical protein